MCPDHLSGHPFMQKRSPFSSSAVGQTLQETRSREEVRLISAKLDGPDSSWLSINRVGTVWWPLIHLISQIHIPNESSGEYFWKKCSIKRVEIIHTHKWKKKLSYIENFTYNLIDNTYNWKKYLSYVANCIYNFILIFLLSIFVSKSVWYKIWIKNLFES